MNTEPTLRAAVECSLALNLPPADGYPILARHGFEHDPDMLQADYSQACAFVKRICRAALASYAPQTALDAPFAMTITKAGAS